jgi:HD-GYP domain-containing protein (c-di-GMP phosphodiesterase class II)
MQLLKLMQNLVRLGEPLPWGVRDAQGNLLLAQGHVVATAAQLAAILERGAFVDVEEVKAAAKRTAEAEKQKQRPASLFTLWERVLWQLDRLLRGSAEPDFNGRADELARHIVALTERDPDIAIYLAVLQDPKRLAIYGLAHSVHCAMVGLLMARRLGWDEAQTQSLMKAALTMNIAMLDLQASLAVQGQPPTQSQQATIREHPEKGVAMLRAAGVDDAAWLDAVVQHHELPDGSGYPGGIIDAAPLSQALHHIDSFVAKISPRAGRQPLSMQQALRELFKEDQGGEAAAAIVKEFGLYPPGDFVKLKTGEHAVVVRRSVTANAPTAASITDRSGMPMVNTIMRDTAKPEYAIVSALSDKSQVLRMQPERLYGLQE